jgi:rubrerythrin
MAFHRVDEFDPDPNLACTDKDHHPPAFAHMYMEPGRYEWSCPSCGHITNVRIPPCVLAGERTTDIPYRS